MTKEKAKKSGPDNLGGLDPNSEEGRRQLAHLAQLALGNISAPDPETVAFDELQDEAHRKMRADFKHRLRTNRTPTTEEISLGTYVENLEPQVREATMAMRRKGYDTASSGFNGGNVDWRELDEPKYDDRHRRAQVMDFRHGFQLSEEVRGRLKELGAEAVGYRDYHPDFVFRIGFEPTTPDLAAIKQQWDDIAAVLPDTGRKVPPIAELPFMFRPYRNESRQETLDRISLI